MKISDRIGSCPRSPHPTFAPNLHVATFWILIFTCCQTNLRAQTSFIPSTHHPNIAGITLFAENPDIMTPIGIAVAPDGRVFVQENHTHKRGPNYDGPQTDRILIFEDTDGDGSADNRTVFYQGHTFSTDLLFGPDGHLYVSTRWFVGRFPDAANKSKADGEPEQLVVCETDGDYPHNGVGGLAIDAGNPAWLAFGFGENLGADYTFVGSDGTKISGGAEGGSTYRCRTDGSDLKRLSTGHWNAFGMTFDRDGNLFSTDNDPNSTPPNRLLHVVPGADFGYEYRYGRSGRHPLVSWYGEIPGTLGMIGPLGEAACGVVAYGDDQLLSASWTDNRIDLHHLIPNGASFEATRDPFISGPDDFRPVHFSYSDDGRYLYFTDWVKLDYPVHGHGRIWRIELKTPVDLSPNQRDPVAELTAADATGQLGNSDPYLRTAAINTLVESPEVLKNFDWQKLDVPVARAHCAVALKRVDPQANSAIIPDLLNDADESVRFVGIKWIADEGLNKYGHILEQQLDLQQISKRNLEAILAALAKIKGETNQEFSAGKRLLELAEDHSKSVKLRAVALRSVPTDLARNSIEVFHRLAQDADAEIQREAVRTLAILTTPGSDSVLRKIAVNPDFPVTTRADAIAGLAAFADQHRDLIQRLAKDENSVIANEAIRTLESNGLMNREVTKKPEPTELAAWTALVDSASNSPDIDNGRRLFFHARLAGCYKCHSMNGRGNDIGPDLTAIHRQSNIDRNWLLEHVVNPNAEVAPYYRPQMLITEDGQVKTGFILGREGTLQAYVGQDGEIFSVAKSAIEERRELTTSIMPVGLLENLHADEIADLLAFLLNGAQQ